MKLKRYNLGCGEKILPGYVNIDLYAPKPDMRADLRTMQLPPEGASECLLVHVVEHFSKNEAKLLLGHIFNWLASGGFVAIEVPDCLKCLNLVAKGRRLANLEMIFRGVHGIMGGRSTDKLGWRRWLLQHVDEILEAAQQGCIGEIEVPDPWNEPGETHFHAWSGAELSDLLIWLGYTNIDATQPPTKHRGKGMDRDSRIVGFKPTRAA